MIYQSTLNFQQISIACFNSSDGIGNSFLIPSGPLREKVDSLKKYDCVFLKGDKTKASKISKYIKKDDR